MNDKKLTREEMERIRFKARDALKRTNGKDQETIAKHCGVDSKTISRWWRAYVNSGYKDDAMKARKAPGAPSLMARAVADHLEALLDRADKHGGAGPLWTIPDLATLTGLTIPVAWRWVKDELMDWSFELTPAQQAAIEDQERRNPVPYGAIFCHCEKKVLPKILQPMYVHWAQTRDRGSIWFRLYRQHDLAVIRQFLIDLSMGKQICIVLGPQEELELAGLALPRDITAHHVAVDARLVCKFYNPSESITRR